MPTDFWWGNQNERDREEDLNVGVDDNIKIDLREIRSGCMDWM
jgi:hypothetical protein